MPTRPVPPASTDAEWLARVAQASTLLDLCNLLVEARNMHGWVDIDPYYRDLVDPLLDKIEAVSGLCSRPGDRRYS